MSLNSVKTALASKTVWGGIIAVSAGLLGMLGYTIDAAAQAEIASDAFNIYTAVVSVVGGVLAIYGRIKASKKIGKQ